VRGHADDTGQLIAGAIETRILEVINLTDDAFDVLAGAQPACLFDADPPLQPPGESADDIFPDMRCGRDQLAGDEMYESPAISSAAGRRPRTATIGARSTAVAESNRVKPRGRWARRVRRKRPWDVASSSSREADDEKMKKNIRRRVDDSSTEFDRRYIGEPPPSANDSMRAVESAISFSDRRDTPMSHSISSRIKGRAWTARAPRSRSEVWHRCPHPHCTLGIVASDLCPG